MIVYKKKPIALEYFNSVFSFIFKPEDQTVLKTMIWKNKKCIMKVGFNMYSAEYTWLRKNAWNLMFLAKTFSF